MSERRAALRVLAGAAAGLLGGCGFRPLHQPAEADDEAGAELARIRVALIPERFGQLLRRTLQFRLGLATGGEPAQPLYDLRVSPAIQIEGLGIERDGLLTRLRYQATANWVLLRAGAVAERLAAGTAFALDASNYPANQYFASDSSRDAAERRLAEQLAEEIAQRLAVDFRRRRIASSS